MGCYCLGKPRRPPLNTLELLLLPLLLLVLGPLGSKALGPIVEPLIGGGVPAPLGSFPWAASLRIFGIHMCGASILSEAWVVSAGHCAKYSSPLLTSLFIPRSSQSRAIREIIIHPNFNPVTLENDIALLLLSTPLIFDSNVGAALLPKSISGVISDDLIVVGWGMSSRISPFRSPILLQASMTFVNRTSCSEAYPRRILPGMVCAVGDGGQGVCLGDSGGPLHNKEDKLLVGIVSWGPGLGCGRATQPSVYTSVPHHLHWIKGHISSNRTGGADYLAR